MEHHGHDRNEDQKIEYRNDDLAIGEAVRHRGRRGGIGGVGGEADRSARIAGTGCRTVLDHVLSRGACSAPVRPQRTIF